MPTLKPITLADFYRQRNLRRGVNSEYPEASYLTDLEADVSRPQNQRGSTVSEPLYNKQTSPGLSDYMKARGIRSYNAPVMSSSHPVVNEAATGGYAEGAEIAAQANEANAAASAGADSAGASTAGSAASYLAIANDIYQGYKATQDDTLSKNQKIRRVRLNGGAGVIDYFVPGLGQAAIVGHDYLEDKTGFSPGDISASEWIAKKLFGSETEREKERIMKQAKKGTKIMAADEANFKDMYLRRPGSHSKQLKESMEKYGVDENFQGFVQDEESPGGARWVNNKFRSSNADETNLTPVDIWGAANMYENFGDKWAETSEYQRYRVAREALKRGLVDEYKGTLDVKENDEWKATSEAILAGEAPPDPEAEKEYNAWKAQENEAKGVTSPPSQSNSNSSSGGDSDTGGDSKNKKREEDSGPATLPEPITPPEQPISTDENYVPIDAYKSQYTDMLKAMYSGAMKNYKNPYGGSYA